MHDWIKKKQNWLTYQKEIKESKVWTLDACFLDHSLLAYSIYHKFVSTFQIKPSWFMNYCSKER